MCSNVGSNVNRVAVGFASRSRRAPVVSKFVEAGFSETRFPDIGDVGPHFNSDTTRVLEPSRARNYFVSRLVEFPRPEPSAVSPQVVIYFCRICGFGPPAEAIAETLRHELNVSVECRPGFWGCFRIEFNGRELFNRWKSRGWLGRLGCGRTPTPQEIVELIRSEQSAS